MQSAPQTTQSLFTVGMAPTATIGKVHTAGQQKLPQQMGNAARAAPVMRAQIPGAAASFKVQNQRSSSINMSMGGNPYQSASFQVSSTKHTSFLSNAATSFQSKQSGRTAQPYMMLGGSS